MKKKTVIRKIDIVVGSEKIERLILAIKVGGIKLDRMIHQAGVSALNHVELHGDPVHVNNLVDAMPKGSRVNALREWFEAFGKVSYDEKTKKFKYNGAKHTLLKDSIKKSWVVFKPDVKYIPFDYDTKLEQFFKLAFARAEKADKSKGDNIDISKLKSHAELLGYAPVATN